MEEKKLYAKKLEKPDFSNPMYEEKILMMYEKRELTDIPTRIFLGKVTSLNNKKDDFYLKGFSLIDVEVERFSELEKQTILGREYFGEWPKYEYPLTNIGLEESAIFYEIEGNLSVDQMRDIADGKDQKLVIEEF